MKLYSSATIDEGSIPPPAWIWNGRVIPFFGDGRHADRAFRIVLPWVAMMDQVDWLRRSGLVKRKCMPCFHGYQLGGRGPWSCWWYWAAVEDLS